MSNRLSIEIADVKWRSTGESQQEIHIFDDEDVASIAHEALIPDEPAEVLKLVCRLAMQGCGEKLFDLLEFHVKDADLDDGIDIENDWVELNDPRISEIVTAYRKDNREFFGLKDDEPDGKEIKSAHEFSVGDQVVVPSGDLNHEFVGRIESFRDENTATVVDQEDNSFDYEIKHLKKAED
jgi:hypothetical protein